MTKMKRHTWGKEGFYSRRFWHQTCMVCGAKRSIFYGDVSERRKPAFDPITHLPKPDCIVASEREVVNGKVS